jgi:hypothetical protein
MAYATIYVMQGEIYSDMPYGQHGSAERSSEALCFERRYPCWGGDFCIWHETYQTLTLGDVRFEEEPGRHLLTLTSSQFDLLSVGGGKGGQTKYYG